MSLSEAEPDELLLRVTQSLFVVLGAVFGASLVVSPAATLARTAGLAADSAEIAVVRTVAQFLGFGLACAVFVYYADARDLITVRVPSLREAALVGGGVVTLLGLQFGLLLGLAELGLEAGQNRAITTDGRPPVYFLYMIAVSVLFVGPAEELLFRGVVQGQIRRVAGPVAAVAFASLVFGVIHFASVTGGVGAQAAYILVATLLGALLGVLYEATGNVAVPALTHGLYNAVLFGLQYTQVAG